MKKLTSLILTLGMILTLTACSQDNISGSSSIKENTSQNNTSHSEVAPCFYIMSQKALDSAIETDKYAQMTSEGNFSHRYFVAEEPESKILDVLEDYHKGKHQITNEYDIVTYTYCPFFKSIKNNFTFFDRDIEQIMFSEYSVSYQLESDKFYSMLYFAYKEEEYDFTKIYSDVKLQESFYAPETSEDRNVLNRINGAEILYSYNYSGSKLSGVEMKIDNWLFKFGFDTEDDFNAIKAITERETVEKFIADVREIAENEFYDYR
ncbi:MAG: hypothetical protein E7490_11145 [Ruminococcaceae bacterium]|nr:hypothetical protein [Oscillospiraceae bacterium]